MGLRKFFDRIEHHFQKGGKLERWYPVYEMVESFIYNPPTVTSGTTHLRDGIDLKRIMTTVYIAILPCAVIGVYNTGLQANLAIDSLGITPDGWRAGIVTMLGAGFDPSSMIDNFAHGLAWFAPLYLIAMIAGGTWELIFSVIRGHDINESFLVTSFLFPLILPPLMPLWQAAIGISFGIVIGKEVFGGTGRNLVNPALISRAFIFFAYPASISGDAVWVAVDGYTRATPLGELASYSVVDGMASASGTSAMIPIEQLDMPVSYIDAALGLISGSIGEVSAVAALLGALYLAYTGVGSWRIMVSSVVGLVATAFLFNAIGSDTNVLFGLSPAWHLVLGGFAFGTAFMATDPVSAAMTDRGKWIYGFLIGALTVMIRVVNPAFPEGVMLAILFMNVFAPTIDHYVIKANVKRRAKRYAL